MQGIFNAHILKAIHVKAIVFHQDTTEKKQTINVNERNLFSTRAAQKAEALSLPCSLSPVCLYSIFYTIKMVQLLNLYYIMNHMIHNKSLIIYIKKTQSGHRKAK